MERATPSATPRVRARQSASRRKAAAGTLPSATIEQLVRQQQEQERCSEPPSLLERIHAGPQKAHAASSSRHTSRVYVAATPAPSTTSVAPVSKRFASIIDRVPSMPNQRDSYSNNDKATTDGADVDDVATVAHQDSRTLSTQHHALHRRALSVNVFEQKYATRDTLLQYALAVIRERRAVQRSEIPKPTHTKRKVAPEDGDVLYLVYDTAPPCGFRNVYWLTFVPETSVVTGERHARDFFTLSTRGITHFDRGAVTEFVAVRDWIDEKRAFDHMTAMRGLQRIQQLLFFCSWRRTTVRQRHRRTRTVLACSLFACHAVAQRVLLQVRAVCTEIEEHATQPHLEPTRIYTLEQYVQLQRERCDAARTFVGTKVATICDLVASATQPLAATKDERTTAPSASSPAALSAALNAASLRERMFRFLRLADLLVGASVYRHLESFLLDLHAHVCGGGTSPTQIAPYRLRAVSVVPASTVSARTAKLCVREPSGIERYELLPFVVRCPLRDAPTDDDSDYGSYPMLFAHVVEALDFASARTDNDNDATAFALALAPSETAVFDAFHSVIGAYMAAMDETPRVLMDVRFSGVLAPFAPHYRSAFVESLGKSSAVALAAGSCCLQSMRKALETSFAQLEALRIEHMQCLDRLRSAERLALTSNASVRSASDGDSDTVVMAGSSVFDSAGAKLDSVNTELDTVSAQRYEAAQTVWTALLAYATSTPSLVQVGPLLVDQRAFVDKVRMHALQRLDELDCMLPSLYTRVLRDVLVEATDKLERVTKIPTTFADATVWLTHVTAMLPTHAFRRRFDAKCMNVAKLRTLLRTRQAASASTAAPAVGQGDVVNDETDDASDRDVLHRLELECESTLETLVHCLARVQDRDSEHRRSFYDLATKTDEYVAAQLELSKRAFEAIPMPAAAAAAVMAPPLNDAEVGERGSAAASAASVRRREKALSAQRDRVVDDIEALVALDTERKSVAQQFVQYERELRAVAASIALADSNDDDDDLSAPRHFPVATDGNEDYDESMLPSEQLLQRVVTALDLRKWFASWTQLVTKWTTTPLTAVHAGMVQIRVRQFRRRLLYAATRLFQATTQIDRSSWSTLSPVSVPTYLANDLALARAFDASIEQAATDCRIFEALSSGAFTDERWQLIDAMLATTATATPSVITAWRISEQRSSLTLQMLKTYLGSPETLSSPLSSTLALSSTQPSLPMATFLTMCDQTIIEAKVQRQIAQARQQLGQLRVVVVEAHYTIRCVNLRDVLAELNDVLLRAKLCLHAHNPVLDAALALCSDVEIKMHMCEHIAQFETQWRSVCAFARLHDADEYFANRKAAAAGSMVLSSSESTDAAQWLALKAASQRWNDRLRRAFCHDVGSLAAAASARDNSDTSEQTDARSTSNCSLDDLVAVFDGFEFEANARNCEAGVALLRTYLDALRALAPRLYVLSDAALLDLLVHDDDVAHVRHSLALCFPQIDVFTIGSSATESDEAPLGRQKTSDPLDGPITDGTGRSARTTAPAPTAVCPIVIYGIESAGPLPLRASFALAVLKIGRVKFWFNRLEDELAALVTTHVRSAVLALLGDGDSASVSVALRTTRLCATLLPQAIALVLQLRFRYRVDRVFAQLQVQHQQPADASSCNIVDDLVQTLASTVDELVVALRRPPNGLHRFDPRIESVVLLSIQQLSVVRRVAQLVRSGRVDDAQCFWTLQLKLGVSLDVATARSMTKAGQAELDRKLLAIRAGEPMSVVSTTRSTSTSANDSAAAPSAATLGMHFYAQVAHIELPIGHEYVGASRLTVVTPLAERCAFALWSAMRLHALALAAPYTTRRHAEAHVSTLSAMSQVLMKPVFAFTCGSNVQTLDGVSRLLCATLALGGVLFIHGFLMLPASLRSACHALLVQAYEHHLARPQHHYIPPVTGAAPALTESEVPVGAGSTARSAPASAYAAVLVPLVGAASVRASGLLDSLTTPFRALAFVRPSIAYVVEAALLLEGFTHAQTAALQLGVFFEALVSAERELVHSDWSFALVSSVVNETQRLRASFRAVSNSESHRSPLPSRRDAAGLRVGVSAAVSRSEPFNAAAEQCICERAVRNIVAPVLMQQQRTLPAGLNVNALMQRFELLVTSVFALSASMRLVADRVRSGGDAHSSTGLRDEDLASALAISLEHARLALSTTQIDVAIAVSRALSLRRAVLLYGPPGSGKTTCIHTLHHALCALEYTAAATGKDAMRREHAASASASSSELVVVNPTLLSYDELYGSPATGGLIRKLLASSTGPDANAYSHQTRTWLLIDAGDRFGSGSAWLEPLLALLSDSTRSLSLRDGSSVVVPLDVRRRVRLIFEVVDLRNVTPQLLVDCWSVFVHADTVSHTDILATALTAWTQQLALPTGSRAARSLATLFATTELLVSTVFVTFIRDEVARAEPSGSRTSDTSGSNGAGVGTGFGAGICSRRSATPELRLGYLSMNHMTQTTLKLLASLCLSHRASLDELSPSQATLLASYAALWGFAGHANDACKHKLELHVRAQSKHFALLKHVGDVPGSLWSGDHVACVWDMLQPLHYQPERSELTAGKTAGANNFGVGASDELVFDTSSAQFVVLAPAARSLVRLGRQLVRSSQSFVITGASAVGKTSLLRLLLQRNADDEAAEAMVDTSINERQAHSVLDWLRMPSAWFSASAGVGAGASAVRDESQLFTPRTTHSMLFLDDLGANIVDDTDMDTNTDISDVSAQDEFVRFVLDHRIAFNRHAQTFRAVDKGVGAAMRIDDNDNDRAATRVSATRVRLLRHFAVLRVPSYGRTQLLSIFRAKFHTHFHNGTGDARASSSAYDPGERLLSIEETALRASVDLAVEMRALQATTRATNVDTDDASTVSCLMFNLHHANALLSRTLAFAASLRNGSGSSTSGTTSLLTLGKLHQCWLSEIRNLFLANASAATTAVAPSVQDHPAEEAAATAVLTASNDSSTELPATPTDSVVAKLWPVLRLLSEKHFSVALGTDDSRALTGIESVFFTHQLATKYAQHSAVVEQLAALREIMSANASASSTSSSTRTRRRNAVVTGTGAGTESTGSGVNSVDSAMAPESHAHRSTSETIQRILLQLASSASWSSARCYNSDDLATLEMKLLLGGSFGLGKTLHLLHALDESHHVVITARSSRGIAESLLRFACDAHGLQIKRLSCRSHPYSSSIAYSEASDPSLDEQLRTILHAAVIQNERTALWINCAALDAVAPPGAHALVDFVRELGLNHVPSLLFRSAALRDAAVLSYVQSRLQLELVREADILHDFADRVQRNLRLCVFVDSLGGSVGDVVGDSVGPRRAQAPPPLVDWLRSRGQFQWFSFDNVECVDDVVLETAHVAANMLELTSASPSSATGAAVAAPSTLASAVAAATATTMNAMSATATSLPACSVPTSTSNNRNGVSNNDANDRARIAAVCYRVHKQLTRSMTPRPSACEQLTYFVSLLKNVVVLHARRVAVLDARVADYACALNTFAAMQQLGRRLAARETVLLARRDVLQAELDRAVAAAERYQSQLRNAKQQLRANRVGRSGGERNDSYSDDDDDDAELDPTTAARREIVTWQLRSWSEELGVAIAECECELRELAHRLREWRDAAASETECVSAWTQQLDAMRDVPHTRRRLLMRVLLQSAQMAYSYVTSLPASTLEACMVRAKQLIAVLDPAVSSFDGNTVGSGSDSVGRCDEQRIMCAIWRTQFRFLRDSHALETIALADGLCDRVPVFVDPTGMLQRVFVHFFTGHALLAPAASASAGASVSGTTGQVSHAEWRDPSLAAMVVAWDDVQRDSKLQDAQRRDVPVLLVLHCDLEHALPELQPFLEPTGGSSSSCAHRQPVLARTTAHAYDAFLHDRDTRRNRTKRHSATATQVAAVASAVHNNDALKAVSSNSSGSTDARVRHPRKKFGAAALSTEIAAAAVATTSEASHRRPSIVDVASAAAGSHHLPHSSHRRGTGFQLYVVTTRAVPIALQHALAMHVAVFPLALEPHALASVFRDVWTRTRDAALHRELFDVDATLLESAHRRQQLESRLIALLVSPIVAPRPVSLLTVSTMPDVLRVFDNYALAPTYLQELSVDTRRHRTEQFLLQQRRAEIVTSTSASVANALANELVAVTAACAAIVPLAGARSQLYDRNVRWLASAFEQQLLAINAKCTSSESMDVVEDDDTVTVRRVVQQLIASYVSTSHRTLFRVVLAVERAAQRSSQHTVAPLRQALALLSGRRDAAPTSTPTLMRGQLDGADRIDWRSKSQTEPVDALNNSAGAMPLQALSASMVDRFRRRVRLCTFVVNHLLTDASDTTTSASHEVIRRVSRRTSSSAMSYLRGGAAVVPSCALGTQRRLTQQTLKPTAAPTPRRTAFEAAAARQLSELLATVDALWCDSRERKREDLRDLQLALEALGFTHCKRLQHRRTPAVASSIDALQSVSDGAVELKTRDDVYRTYAVEPVAHEQAVSDLKRLERLLARLLIAKMHFPDSFADALTEGLGAIDEQDDSCSNRSGNDVTWLLSLRSSTPSSLSRVESKRVAAGSVATRVVRSVAAVHAADVVMLRSHERTHLPAAIAVYDSLARASAERMLAAWTSQQQQQQQQPLRTGAITVLHYDASALRARLTALVTTTDWFVVELLAPDAFDAVLALVAQLINQHALLAPPEWFVLLALPVARRVYSSVAPLVPTSVLVSDDSTSNSERDSVQRFLMDRNVTEPFAAQWIAAAVCDDPFDDDSKGDMCVPALSNLRDVALEFRAIGDVCTGIVTASPERKRFEDALIAATTRIRQPLVLESSKSPQSARRSASGTRMDDTRSCAAHSAEMLIDLLLLHRSMKLTEPDVLALADVTASATDQALLPASLDRQAVYTAPTMFASDRTSCATDNSDVSTSDAVASRVLDRIEQLWTRINALSALLRNELALASLQSRGDSRGYRVPWFVPWRSLTDEFDTFARAFSAITASFESLLAQTHTAHNALLSTTAQQQIASLASDRVPFEWVQRAFGHTVGPTTSISTSQLALLVTSRLALLVDCMSDNSNDSATCISALNLAALSDARVFVAALKMHCAAHWCVSVANVVLVLDADNASMAADGNADTDAQTAESHCDAPPMVQSQSRSAVNGSEDDDTHCAGVVSAALVRDATGAPCGIRVDGLVVVEQSDSSTSAGCETHLHALPRCRLYCSTTHELERLERLAATDTERNGNINSGSRAADTPTMTAAAAVPFVMLPSLSPYQQPPRVLDRAHNETDRDDATLDAAVHIRGSLGATISALSAIALRRDRRRVAFAIGALMFIDDDDDDTS